MSKSRISDIKLSIEDKVSIIVKYKDGRVKTRQCKGKTVTDDGLDWLVNRMDMDSEVKMQYIAVGSGTNTPLATDTELQTELLRKTFSVSTNPSTGKKHWEAVIDTTELNGETLAEIGVFNDAEVGTMLLRKLLDPAEDKTSDKEITIIVEVTVSKA